MAKIGQTVPQRTGGGSQEPLMEQVVVQLVLVDDGQERPTTLPKVTEVELRVADVIGRQVMAGRIKGI